MTDENTCWNHLDQLQLLVTRLLHKRVRVDGVEGWKRLEQEIQALEMQRQRGDKLLLMSPRFSWRGSGSPLHFFPLVGSLQAWESLKDLLL